jgi:hypothetical protein
LELPKECNFISKVLRIRSIDEEKLLTLSIVDSSNQSIAELALPLKQNEIVLQPEKHPDLFQAMKSENARYITITPTFNQTDHLGE